MLRRLKTLKWIRAYFFFFWANLLYFPINKTMKNCSPRKSIPRGTREEMRKRVMINGTDKL